MTSPRAPHTPELRSALTDESGFTLVELFVTVAILGVLLAFAVPAYLSFRGKAQSTAARSEVREVIPSANAYYVTNDNFTGMSSNALRSGYDSGLTISNGSSTDICRPSPRVTARRTASRPSLMATGRTTAGRRLDHRRPEHAHREPLLLAVGVRWSHGGAAWL